MFIELSDGTILNLNHVRCIPVVKERDMGFKQDIKITLSNNESLWVTKGDALRIRAIFQSEIIKKDSSTSTNRNCPSSKS